MDLLSVNSLTKRYPKFLLDNVSFHLEQGYIMGFIGSNGAGKTSTFKAIMNFIHPNTGSIKLFGKELIENENNIKQDIGVLLGETDYYLKRKVKSVSDVVRRFYHNWDDEMYQKLIKRFNIDIDKKLSELSKGMRVKFGITLALCHDAKLFILDEPTSGLDPVARDEVLELFQELVEDGKKSILFSTHITSDLEKCADYVTYIKNGKIVASTTYDELIEKYKLVKGSKEELDIIKNNLISYKISSFGFTGLVKSELLDDVNNLEVTNPSLEEIMIFYAKEEFKND